MLPIRPCVAARSLTRPAPAFYSGLCPCRPASSRPACPPRHSAPIGRGMAARDIGFRRRQRGACESGGTRDARIGTTATGVAATGPLAVTAAPRWPKRLEQLREALRSRHYSPTNRQASCFLGQGVHLPSPHVPNKAEAYAECINIVRPRRGTYDRASGAGAPRSFRIVGCSCKHTFVQPVEYTRLLVALRTPGRGIVIEGPSGIGKTTAIVNAIEEAGLSDRVMFLSARKNDDVDLNSELPHLLPFGTVLIDDFIASPISPKQWIADLMKTLADEGASHSKVVVLGITNAGQSLISFGKDLANRIEIIPFEANPEYKVEELLEKGERALHISLNIRAEIVGGSQGSFYLAQMLAYHTCIRSGVLKTANPAFTTSESYESVKGSVMTMLARSFHDTAISFARGTKLRREGRAPYLHISHERGPAGAAGRRTVRAQCRRRARTAGSRRRRPAEAQHVFREPERQMNRTLMTTFMELIV